MLFLARFILKGQSQAALVAASMAILGMVIPPAAWVSAAVIVLVTLVNGPKPGLVTTFVSLLGAAVFGWLIFSAPEVAFVFVLMAWLPAWLVASVLRQTVSLAYSLQALTGVCLAVVALIYVLFPDFGEFWRQPLDEVIRQLVEQSSEFDLAELKQTEDWVIGFLPGLFTSSIMFGTMISLFLGRWWQAVFYNPGGFAKEFQSLNLGTVSALIASAILVMAFVIGNMLTLGLATVVFVLYSIQALSLLHAVVNIRKLSGAWLFFIYAVMFFIPQVLMLLMMAALADPWLDLRQRIKQPA